MFDLVKTRPILVLAVIVSNILLSAWCLSQDPIINNDGVTYIAIARLIVDGQWQLALEYYNWPYYPLLLASVSKLLLIDLELAAHGLNVFFIIVLCFGFICTVSVLTSVPLSLSSSVPTSVPSKHNANTNKNHQRIVLIAALVIVLFPSITKYRSFIIRDFAYLSCYIWSLYFIFKYCHSGRLTHLFSWLGFAIIGCLFRFESIAFVLMTPYFYSLVSKPDVQIRRPILMLLISVLATACIALFWWYANEKYAATIAYAQSNGENINNLWDLFFANTASENNQSFTFGIFIQQSLNNMGTVAYELARRMAVVYLIFSIVAYTKNLVLEKGAQTQVWLCYVFINLLILVGFSFFNNFLVSRYTLATAITLLLLSPFAINRLIEYLTASNGAAKSNAVKKASLVFFTLILLAISFERLNIETDKLPRKEAGLWLAKNVSPDAKIFSTDKIINYYAGRNIEDTERVPHSYKSLQNAFFSKQIKSEDYIAFVTDFSIESHRIMWQTLTYHFGTPIKRMKINDQDSVVIYSHHKSNLKTLNLRY